ncbi:hypothetical protein KAU45_01855 [bacterium]|nr:hypothetical protein [bacterium]
MIERDNGLALTVELRDEPNCNSTELSDTYSGGIPLSWIRLTILEVYPGEEWDDTCIAEVVPYFTETWKWNDE